MLQNKIEIARNRILNDTLLAFAILGIPLLASSLIRTIQIGWNFLFTWHIFLVTLLWTVYLLRHLIPIITKIMALVAMALITGIYGAYELGLQGGWQVMVISAPVLVTIFYGRYNGLILLSIIGVFLSIIAYLYISNSLSSTQDFFITNSSATFWTNTIITILLMMAPLLISIGKVQQLLNKNINDLSIRTDELNQAQLELKTTFDFIPIPIIVFNEDNEILRINKRFTKLLGYTLVDFTTLSDFFEKAFPNIEDRAVALDLWNTHVKDALNNKLTLQPGMFEIQSLGGNKIHIEILFKAFENKIMAVFNDLSFQIQSRQELLLNEAKLKQQNDEFLNLNKELLQSNDRITEMNQKLLLAKKKAEESDHHKTIFLQNMSHEIRTPLNAIIGFTEMLTDQDLPEEQRTNYLDIILNSSNQLLDVVNDIINVSSVEAGRAVLIEEPTNINQLLNSLLPQFQLRSKESGISISTHFSLQDDESEVMMDGKKVKQIMTNLINNAFKFTSKGKVSIGYNLRSPFIVFYVKDTGVGVKPEHHQSIFERFNKGDQDLARKYTGTGLGLSICKAFVELMGGRIWLLSEEGKGSTFFFTVPYKTPDPQK